MKVICPSAKHCCIDDCTHRKPHDSTRLCMSNYIKVCGERGCIPFDLRYHVRNALQKGRQG